MPGIHIYVGAGLRARMDAMKGDVNWSQVAAEAFESRLAAREASGGGEDLEEVARRLSRSRAASADGREQVARAAGDRWARERAEWDQLLRLEELAAAWSDTGPLAGEADGTALVAALWRALHACGDGGEPCEADLAWWLDAVDLPADAGRVEAEGFVAGALAIFRAVRDRV